MAHIVIINPRFEDSFWGMESCMSILGKRANLPVAVLPLLAALTPDKHQVTLVDENVEAINFELLSEADIVCVTGMYIQRVRMQEILEEAKSRGCFTVVGGPLITVVEDHFDEELIDVKFLGEADETWPAFLEAWEHGTHKSRYTQPAKTDMTSLPTPRLDLLKTQHYMFGSMQISRGCPYQCEFCDIIITFGRRPRLKCSHQVITELQASLDAGFQILFVVDDNLIGNKKEIKPILRDIIKWQRERNYPLILFTEASLDLAEDDELMELMGEAGFQCVFVGIESINEESLKETKKYQNVRPKAGSILDRIQRITDNGIDVWCGMILGFDHDDRTVFDTMPEFLQQTRITNALIGLLHAIPTTPLFARLLEEGRVDMDGIEEWATNVIPAQMSREELREGFVKVMRDVYDIDRYFERVDGLLIDDNFTHATSRLPFWKKHRWSWFKRCAKNYVRFAVLYRRLTRDVPEKHLRKRYRQQLLKMIRARGFEPHMLFAYALKVTMHYHFNNTVERMAKEFTPVANVR